MITINGEPVLYICPYCKSGRFTKQHGWNMAVQHIKTCHPNEIKRKYRRGAGGINFCPPVYNLLFDKIGD